MPSLPSSMRRDSTSTVSSTPSVTPSVTVNTSTPAFRALRSLLPFAPNKQPTVISSNVSTSENSVSSVFKNSFAASFGSVRRKSISKDRKSSISQESPPLPVISIGPEHNTEPQYLEEPPIRRSLSYSDFERPVTKAISQPVPDDETKSLGGSQRTIQAARTPSPLLQSAADLSTILEADTSRDLLSATSSRAASMSPAIPSSQLGGPEFYGTSPNDPQDSFLHFSPALGRHADLDEEEYTFHQDHPSTGTVLIHSAENSAHLGLNRTVNGKSQRDSNNSLNLDSLDPDLRALLSPNKCDEQGRRGSSATTSAIHTSTSSPVSQYYTPTTMSTETTPPAARDRFVSSSNHPPTMSRSRAGGRESLLPRLRTHKANTSESSTGASAPNSPVTPTFRNNGSTTSLTQSTSARYDATPLAKASKKRENLLKNSHSRSVSTSGPSTSRKFTPQTQRKVSQIGKEEDNRRASISGIPRLSSPFKPHLQRSTTSTSNVTVISRSPEASEFGERSRRPTGSLPRPGATRLSTTLREGAPRSSIDSTRSDIIQPKDRGADWTITPRNQQQHRAPGMMRSASGGVRERSGTVSTSDTRGRYSAGPDEGPHGIERSTSVQEQYRQLGHGRRGPSRASSRTRGDEEEVASPAMRVLRSPGFDDDGIQRASSSLSGRLGPNGRIKTEWLGPRTIKAFQAAGLMGDREHEERFTPGSMPMDSHMHNLGSLRGMSDHGLRSPSRAAFSESESGGRRSTYNYRDNLQESPTYTVSSGSGRDRDRERLQDTPRSSSTAPTSISGWNRLADPPEIQDLKDRHALETGALLSALSDSQRVARVLRSENDELRGRLERVEGLERENVSLKEEVADLEAQLGLYKREVSMLLARARENQMKSTFATWNAPRQRSGLGTTSPIAGMLDEEDDDQDTIEQEMEHTQTAKTPLRERHFGEPSGDNASPDFNLNLSSADLNNSNPLLSGKIPPPNFSSTPTSTQRGTHRRRLSTTSSVFPVVPANMTMLLHDQAPGYDSEQESLLSNGSNPLTSSTAPMPIARSTPQKRDDSRMTSISPSSTSFSMFTTTGSPSTLSLRPEHELHLGDLESLDLGIQAGDDSEDHDDINISQLLRT